MSRTAAPAPARMGRRDRERGRWQQLVLFVGSYAAYRVAVLANVGCPPAPLDVATARDALCWLFAVAVTTVVAATAKGSFGAADRRKARNAPADPGPPRRPLVSLPRELWGEVCDALDARDVATLACCDGARRAAADGPPTWRRLFDRDWGPTLKRTRSLSLAYTPREPGWVPPLGYKAFYSAFACTWVERAVVGANVEGSRVLVGIHGAVYDITAFAPQHPGSLDTVLDFAGTDATTFFEDVGHSSVARKIMRPMKVLGPGTAAGCLAVVKASLAAERAALARRHPSKLCPTCHEPVHFYDAALFYDAVRAHWALWWPCCGERPVDAVPPHEGGVLDWRALLWRRPAEDDAAEGPGIR